jgi:GTP-binding protein HflX
LHVRDISHPETQAQLQDVEAVLSNLGIDAAAAESPVLEVWNKADRLDASARTEAERVMARVDRPPVLISALTGEGIEAMLAAIDVRFGGKDEILSLEIPPGEGRLLSWLYDNAQVLEQQAAENGAVTARFRIDPTIKGKLEGQLKHAGLTAKS